MYSLYSLFKLSPSFSPIHLFHTLFSDLPLFFSGYFLRVRMFSYISCDNPSTFIRICRSVM